MTAQNVAVLFTNCWMMTASDTADIATQGCRMIIDHNHPAYRARWNNAGAGKFNGAFFYSKEIVKNIIPNVRTDRNWVTINIPGFAPDHSIVFIHNNKHPWNYNWLENYEDLILVCGVPETCEKVAHLGKTIYLPLSVDVEDVAKYRCEKTKEIAFAGRLDKARVLSGVDMIGGLPRTKLLPEMAKYRKIYAVGRTAIEAKILNCEVLPYDQRFPDPKLWRIVDNSEAAKILQRELDRIDG